MKTTAFSPSVDIVFIEDMRYYEGKPKLSIKYQVNFPFKMH
jgi:hypothetical protein